MKFLVLIFMELRGLRGGFHINYNFSIIISIIIIKSHCNCLLMIAHKKWSDSVIVLLNLSALTLSPKTVNNSAILCAYMQGAGTLIGPCQLK